MLTVSKLFSDHMKHDRHSEQVDKQKYLALNFHRWVIVISLNYVCNFHWLSALFTTSNFIASDATRKEKLGHEYIVISQAEISGVSYSLFKLPRRSCTLKVSPCTTTRNFYFALMHTFVNLEASWRANPSAIHLDLVLGRDVDWAIRKSILYQSRMVNYHFCFLLHSRPLIRYLNRAYDWAF